MGGTSRYRSHRLVAAVVSSAAALVAFVALGGAGLAEGAISLAQNQHDHKATVCHKDRNTITVSVNALPAHEAHGDTQGACAPTGQASEKGTKATKKPRKASKPTKAKATNATPTKAKPAKAKGVQSTSTQSPTGSPASPEPTKTETKKRKPSSAGSSRATAAKQAKAPKPTKAKASGKPGRADRPPPPAAAGGGTSPPGNGQDGSNAGGDGKGNGKK